MVLKFLKFWWVELLFCVVVWVFGGGKGMLCLILNQCPLAVTNLIFSRLFLVPLFPWVFTCARTHAHMEITLSELRVGLHVGLNTFRFIINILVITTPKQKNERKSALSSNIYMPFHFSVHPRVCFWLHCNHSIYTVLYHLFSFECAFNVSLVLSGHVIF